MARHRTTRSGLRTVKMTVDKDRLIIELGSKLTEAAKIYDTQLSTTIAERTSSAIQPTGISLLPNYPNPFNPSTKIGFYLSKESSISIAVVTMEGKKIELISNKIYGAGEHWASINLGQMASGNYLLLVQNNKGSISRVISLIK